MPFEIIYQNHKFIIDDEINNETEGYETGNSYIKINVLDLNSMRRYECKINDCEGIDNLPNFMKNLQTIFKIICSALKEDSKTVSCKLIKEKKSIILNIKFKSKQQ